MKNYVYKQLALETRNVVKYGNIEADKLNGLCCRFVCVRRVGASAVSDKREPAITTFSYRVCDLASLAFLERVEATAL